MYERKNQPHFEYLILLLDWQTIKISTCMYWIYSKLSKMHSFTWRNTFTVVQMNSTPAAYLRLWVKNVLNTEIKGHWRSTRKNHFTALWFFFYFYTCHKNYYLYMHHNQRNFKIFKNVFLNIMIMLMLNIANFSI